ncbi:unnamed protein product, partial [Ilex paraguariensis]
RKDEEGRIAGANRLQPAQVPTGAKRTKNSRSLSAPSSPRDRLGSWSNSFTTRSLS